MQSSYLLLAVLGVVGCAGELPVQESEAELGPWMKHSEVFDNPVGVFRGSPSWAEDGSDTAGIELHYERQLQVPPLQGWWSKRNFSFRIFKQVAGSTTQTFAHADQIPGQPTSLYYFKRKGYLLASRALDGGTTGWVIVRGDGRWTTVGQDEPLPHYGERDVIPAPTGDQLADVVCTLNKEVPTADAISIEPVRPIPCTVTFLDADTLKALGPTRTVYLPDDVPWGEGPSRPERATWTSNGTLVVTDRNQTAFALTATSGPTAIAVPTCAGPNTTSSKVAADGRRLAVKNGRNTVVSTAPIDQRFGCK